MRPVVIAHRGASGYVPEHTLAAKALAYSMGADYLEQDVVATQDNELVVLHDIHLDRVTNVAACFPDRSRDDGRFYVRDFLLDEIKTLTVHERQNSDGSMVYPDRYQGTGETFRVNTLAEELTFIAELISSVGRPVGIYPEIKKPAWHLEEGVDISVLVLETLQQFDFDAYDDAAYLQCFDDRELVRIREELGCELKLIQLIGENEWGEADTNYNTLRNAKGLQRLAETVDGVGPWLPHLYTVSEDAGICDSGFVSDAHDAGLAVHPYTFRTDDLAPGFDSFEVLLRFAIEQLSVDGLFTDFPDRVVKTLGKHASG